MVSVLIDSSNTDLAVGLAKDHVLIDKTEYPAWQEQSELLVAELDKLLKKNHLSRKDIAFVVASKGPGSYTGVRIALSVAKVMAFALQVPFYLSSSLEALKVADKATICLMNARSKRSYIGVYEGDKCLMADTILENEEVLKYIKDHPTYVVSGELSQLGLSDKPVDVLGNLLKGDVERNLVKEPLAAKPVYLKDSYPV